jgi:hypothetical protein
MMGLARRLGATTERLDEIHARSTVGGRES